MRSDTLVSANMATTESCQNITANVNSLSINGDHGDNNVGKSPLEKLWGFQLEELYRLALAFYKEKEGKAMHLKYQDKLKLVSYTKQVTYGKYRADLMPAVGLLDVVGNDRRQAWQTLGDMPKEKSMAEFVKQLDALCPLLRPYIQAHKAEKEERERKLKEEEERLKREAEERERQKLEEAQKLQDEETSRQKQLESQIRAALNQQTAIHFKQYAEQQHPGNLEQQEQLIRQLQEQHYQQYMQQVYQQQLVHQQQQYQQLQAMASSAPKPPAPTPDATTMNHVDGHDPSTQPTAAPNTAPSDGQSNAIVSNGVDTDSENDQEDFPPISAASMWNRKDVKDFKQMISKEPESVIKVGSGETVTVRVPTHEDGACLFWEFATDYYDIGFGVYFEWTVAPSNTVSVHVSESSDEEDPDEEGTEDGRSKGPGDVEQGKKVDNKPPTDEIIPVYRRDCHEEVYCGSHSYPGRGVYLLKFDNSYSLWRSKTLYYRVYYTR